MNARQRRKLVREMHSKAKRDHLIPTFDTFARALFLRANDREFIWRLHRGRTNSREGFRRFRLTEKYARILTPQRYENLARVLEHYPDGA